MRPLRITFCNGREEDAEAARQNSCHRLTAANAANPALLVLPPAMLQKKFLAAPWPRLLLQGVQQECSQLPERACGCRQT